MQGSNGQLILELKRRIEEDFTHGDWEEIGLLTDCSEFIDGHGRLLRSLHFGDEDYSGNIIQVLKDMDRYKQGSLDIVKTFLDKKYPDQNLEYVSAKPSEKKITFAPSVFSVPDSKPENDLVAVMMPFDASFDQVYVAIVTACNKSGFRCLRADDIWETSTIMQDIFNLIYRAEIVVVDFSKKNPNVMYETGIAHTLGKTVIPITQHLEDVPSDMIHHRVLIYHNNGEGVQKLSEELRKKLSSMISW